MRILGFTEKWPKLQEPEFTTFRFRRRDRDWEVGELIQVVYQPRRKGGGEKLGVAEIVGKELERIRDITEREAREDGFQSAFEMWLWLNRTHKQIGMNSEMNKLTLRVVSG